MTALRIQMRSPEVTDVSSLLLLLQCLPFYKALIINTKFTCSSMNFLSFRQHSLATCVSE